ncbi:hypothetical protein [Candidatus Halocynthiibacter alkanivorans]|jgi:hypothetical protein|uniref:hypothetical protein n=1 Tax=Candidatus Halocynthiibacter alkanivorans TaxID=2267619 RepID=UPI000DF28FE7|nr:hypothetical protein [Candidatus Halocynthiibacter alkanivorans]
MQDHKAETQDAEPGSDSDQNPDSEAEVDNLYSAADLIFQTCSTSQEAGSDGAGASNVVSMEPARPNVRWVLAVIEDILDFSDSHGLEDLSRVMMATRADVVDLIEVDENRWNSS